VADLGEGPGPPLFWVIKEEMTEGRKAGRASKTKPPPAPPPPALPPTPPPAPLGQGLDLPLMFALG